MKQTLLVTGCIAAAMLAATSVSASHTVLIKDTEMQLDTIFHAKVGPGTTQTQLRLTGAYGPLDVFYLTVDKTTPGVTMRAVSGGNKLAGGQRTSSMAEEHSDSQHLYFAGTNGDFYYTSGSATNGSTKIGTPTGTCIVDGEIFKTSNSNYQFSVDTAGVARVCRMNYYQGTATIGDRKTYFKGVNVDAPANGITIYTPRFWGSANQVDYANISWGVTAKLVEGDTFTAGRSYRMEVTSEPDATGDLAVPNDGYVIFGRGKSATDGITSALDFVGGLHPGDIVEFDNVVLTPEGERFVPVNAVSGNPKNVGNGEILDSEGERGDASANHPRTGIGYSQTGDSIIMMVIDGRSPSSVGVRTSVLAAVMRYAGAFEAVNLDGGGSSTLYTSALGVRNHTSDGTERAVGNAIFACMTVPEGEDVNDPTPVALEFRDPVLRTPSYGLYTPRIYAFNKYGVCINTNFKDYTLSCPDELGEIINDGKTLYTSGSGTHALTVSAEGCEPAKIAITIDNSNEARVKYPTVILDDKWEWPVELVALVGTEYLPVAPLAYNWTSADVAVATVTDNGTVKGVANGTTTLTGTSEFQTVVQTVEVQLPEGETMPVEAEHTADDWTVSKTSISSLDYAVLGSGFAVDYTVSSTRATKITFAKKIDVWSIPTALRVVINPGSAIVKNLTITVRAQNDVRTSSYTFENIESNQLNELVMPLADVVNTSDIGVFPLEFSSLAFEPGDKSKTKCHVEIPAIEAVYGDITGGVGSVGAAADRIELRPDGTLVLPADVTAVEVYDVAGRLVSGKGLMSVTPGVYIIKMTTPRGTTVQKQQVN